jgi:hypothetical protein
MNTIIEFKDDKLIDIVTDQEWWDNNATGSYHDCGIISTLYFGFESGAKFNATLYELDFARFLDIFYGRDFSNTTVIEFLNEFISNGYLVQVLNAIVSWTYMFNAYFNFGGSDKSIIWFKQIYHQKYYSAEISRKDCDYIFNDVEYVSDKRREIINDCLGKAELIESISEKDKDDDI